MKKFLNLIYLIFIIYLILNYPSLTNLAKENVNFFITNLFPSLFPLMAFLTLYLKLNLHLYLLPYFKIITPLIGIKEANLLIITLTIILGYPLNYLLIKKFITPSNEKEIVKILTIFSYPSLPFTIYLSSILNNNFFLLSFFLISLTIYLFSYQNIEIPKSSTKVKLLNALNNSLVNSLQNCLIIFANILLFASLTLVIKFNNESINLVIKTLLEYSKTIIYLASQKKEEMIYSFFALSYISGGLVNNLIFINNYPKPIYVINYYKNKLIIFLIINVMIILNIY